MPERILIFGNGWIGNKLSTGLNGDLAVGSDITDRESILRTFDEYDPSVVVNAAGKTGRPNIDGCEKEPAATLSANVAGPVLLAGECYERGIFMVHMGSGCIYDGPDPVRKESDPPDFFGSLYSRSKIASEMALSNLPILQIRLRMPFDGIPHQRNLITKLVGYRRVINVPNSLTCLDDLVLACRHLIDKRRTGIWNVANPGYMTHGEILELYRKIVDPGFRFELMSLEELSKVTVAGRSNCILDTSKLLGEVEIRPIEQAMIDTLYTYKERLR